MLIAARSSQDLACCLRATVSARWKYASTNAEELMHAALAAASQSASATISLSMDTVTTL
jgi:hypothetical protein